MIVNHTQRFQWNDGYTQRHGLTFVDFRNQTRTVKNSGLWSEKLAATNRLDGPA
ncbi:MAG: family 1 glycosylhydrolase [Terracidiphilus sp.]